VPPAHGPDQGEQNRQRDERLRAKSHRTYNVA
jgi:hypothetical protein